MFYLEPVPVDLKLKVDDNNVEIPMAAAEKVSSVKVHDVEDSSTGTIAAKCDPARSTLKRELILQ